MELLIKELDAQLGFDLLSVDPRVFIYLKNTGRSIDLYENFAHVYVLKQQL